MKHSLALACLLSLNPGCASTSQTDITDPVGPPPSSVSSGPQQGALIVYSAFAPGNPSQLAYASRRHSEYRLLSEDGAPVKKIYNHTSAFREDPQVVSLAPGAYKVVAPAAAIGTVTVRVVIKSGQTTSVHLDGSEPPGDTNGSQLVHLPNGRLIGWAANSGR